MSIHCHGLACPDHEDAYAVRPRALSVPQRAAHVVLRLARLLLTWPHV